MRSKHSNHMHNHHYHKCTKPPFVVFVLLFTKVGAYCLKRVLLVVNHTFVYICEEVKEDTHIYKKG